jgi:hypothetical protein
MDLLHDRCAGLDVHQATVVACVRWVHGRVVRREVREFGTSTRELHELGDWLRAHGVIPVVLESTGVYWKPLWHVLAGAFALVLANATRVRNLPGRKSDVNDAVWLADLLAHGLIPASFVPDAVVQTVRGFTRTRTQLVREHSRHPQRVHNANGWSRDDRAPPLTWLSFACDGSMLESARPAQPSAEGEIHAEVARGSWRREARAVRRAVRGEPSCSAWGAVGAVGHGAAGALNARDFFLPPSGVYFARMATPSRRRAAQRLPDAPGRRMAGANPRYRVERLN